MISTVQYQKNKKYQKKYIRLSVAEAEAKTNIIFIYHIAENIAFDSNPKEIKYFTKFTLSSIVYHKKTTKA